MIECRKHPIKATTCRMKNGRPEVLSDPKRGNRLTLCRRRGGYFFFLVTSPNTATIAIGIVARNIPN